jgi:hypothetical protein
LPECKFKAVNTRVKNVTVAKGIEQVEASVACWLAALAHADWRHDDVSEAKTARIQGHQHLFPSWKARTAPRAGIHRAINAAVQRK